jgi:signal transduction histidine kinase
MPAFGSSMFPCVPSGSVLDLGRPTQPIRLGDIVAYPSASGALVAHRVVGIERDRLAYLVRGDAQADLERVEARAVLFVVERVERRGFAYATGGPIGRLLGALALRHRPALRLLGRGLNTARRVRQLVGLWSTARDGLPEADGGGRGSAAADGGEFDESAAHGGGAGNGVPARGGAGPALACHHAENPAAASGRRFCLLSSHPSLPIAGKVDPRESLLRGLKHELRTPLNAILGFAELLLGELDGPLGADERENLTVVREAGQRLLRMINDLLDLSSALIVPREPFREDVDVVLLLEQVGATLEQRRGLRPVHVRVDRTLGRLDLFEEKRALERVLTAFGEVALAATSAGEIALAVDPLPSGELELRVFGEGLVETRAEPGFAPADSPAPSERERRVFRLRATIACRVLAALGGTLERVAEPRGLTLILRIPAPANRRRGPAREEDDVALVTTYIASMGHDLRTPLNAILGFADLLLMGGSEIWSESQRKSLRIVREHAGDLALIVDDMLDWARLEAGELTLERSGQAVLPLLERAIETAVARSGARGLRVLLDSPAELGVLDLDPARFVQAVVGLLDHAIRADPAPQVTLSAALGAKGLRIEVLDPGLEIRPQDQAALFAAFRPSYAPTGQRIEGLQLGTSVARSLMRAHGGEVWFERRGRGTVFIATLPTTR